MSVTVETADPRAPAVAALIGESHALMRSLFPPEDNFHYGLDELSAPHITFFVARRKAETLGTAALADMGGYGEVKQMFVVERARGTGTGAALLARIEDEARAKGLPALLLETGNRLEAAIRLYARAGFTERGPFGDYPAARTSVFMEKRLG
mgnify:CR=1 FL=1